MPRQTIVVNNFSGGLSNHGTAKDIKDNELYVANNILVSTEGLISMPGGPEQQLRPLGSTESTDSEWSSILSDLSSGTVKTGYGLFAFSADRSSTGGLVPTDYFVFCLKDGSNLKSAMVTEKDGTVWTSTGGSSTISLTTGASTYDYKPVMYYVNNGLRICDSNFDDTATTRQGLFYIKHKVYRIYNSTSNFGNYDGWYSTSVDLQAPTEGLVADINSSILTGTCTSSTDANTKLKVTGASHFAGFSSILAGYWVYNTNDQKKVAIVSATDQEITTNSTAGLSWTSGDRYTLLTSAGNGFTISLDSIGSSGTWSTGEYEVAASYVYDNSQETPLFVYETTKPFDITTAGQSLRSVLTFHGSYPRRVTGARAYIRKRETDDAWSLLADVDFTKEEVSGRTSLGSPFTARNSGLNATLLLFQSGAASDHRLVIDSPSADTYESISGVPAETTTMTVAYKCAAVSNNVTYIGNVKLGDKIYDDSIFKSHVNGHDMFYADRRLDVASGDGERIIALHSFADRLLEFKERTMYIINVSQDVESLEDVHHYKGIQYPHQAVNTEYGIAWVNNYGVYLYNGERVIDLFLDPEIQGRRKIDLGYFRSFLGTTPTITYDGREKRLLIVNNTTAQTAVNDSVLIYDMLDNSWVRWNSTSGNHGWANGTRIFTNFVTDFDRYPIAFDTASMWMSKWISTQATTGESFLVETKNFDFDEPGLKKNVYKVYITYKGQNIQPWFRINEDTALYSLYTTTSSTQVVLPATSSYITLELTPSLTSVAKNIYSFQIVLKASTGGTVNNHGINDITIIGRIKGKR